MLQTKNKLILLGILLSISGCVAYTPYDDYYPSSGVYGGYGYYYDGPSYEYYGGYYWPWFGYYDGYHWKHDGKYYGTYHDGYHGDRHRDDRHRSYRDPNDRTNWEYQGGGHHGENSFVGEHHGGNPDGGPHSGGRSAIR